ncbi:MAG: histidine kinase [bacterium]|nr:sensor histidine kinase [Gammaproteobacteria bacterium]
MDIQTALHNKNYQFWALQLAGFGGYGVSFYFGVAFWDKVPEYYYVYLPTVCIIGILITLVLRALYRAMWDMTFVQRLVGVVLGSYLAAAAWKASRLTLFPIFYPDKYELHDWREYFLLGSHFWVMAGWSGLYIGVKYYLLLQEERQQNLKISALAQAAQLKMLRYQLNPHFLFNTLNAISTLILARDNDLAQAMVTRLSSFLRYSLDNDPVQKVSLDQEVDALKLYLAIEQVRFDERLKVKFDISDEAMAAQVPSLLLQPLVENSIKYAISQSETGGTVCIRGKVMDDKLSLEVIDDGPGIQPLKGNKGTGLGLTNTENRRQELYGKNQTFSIGKVTPRGFSVKIFIPYEIANNIGMVAAK